MFGAHISTTLQSLRTVQAAWIRQRHALKPKVLLYTDSRAVDVGRRYLKRDPLHFYPGDLARDFSVRAILVPHKHTTIVDFLNDTHSLIQWADIVLCHVGIVDFSPRCVTDAVNNIYNRKGALYDSIFGRETMAEHLADSFNVEYEGERTINMFSIRSMQTSLVPRLADIPKLIYIGCNNIIPGWRGNYFRNRPANIGIVTDYSKALCKALPVTVDLSDWTDQDVKQNTCDNIHLTPRGSTIVFNRIREKILSIV